MQLVHPEPHPQDLLLSDKVQQRLIKNFNLERLRRKWEEERGKGTVQAAEPRCCCVGAGRGQPPAPLCSTDVRMGETISASYTTRSQLSLVPIPGRQGHGVPQTRTPFPGLHGGCGLSPTLPNQRTGVDSSLRPPEWASIPVHLQQRGLGPD